MPYTILTINPGSTSTKFGVFEDEKELFSQNVTHSSEVIATFPTMASQYEFREAEVRKALAERKFDLHRLSVIVGRGGVLRPIPGGVYRITEAMKRTLETARYGEHASNLGALIADGLAKELGIPAFIADPVVVDELDEVARISGHRLFQRRSIFHALNQKAVARRWCREHGKDYGEAALIVAHMGGGVSVGLHDKGRVVDVNNALNGEGPYSPERSGTLPAGDLVKLCFSGKYQEREILKMITGQGGLVSFMGSNDMRVAEKGFHEGDSVASLYYRAFIYQVGKAIGALGAAARGRVDAIILTGGVAYGKDVEEGVTAMCGFIAPIVVYPGEGELEALAMAGLRAMSDDSVAKNYEEE
ncbi:MAG TPA: butyrate kinase [Rectinemataceae bacterium]|nr:butyrate kinase [Rectinemataceae bacterium]